MTTTCQEALRWASFCLRKAGVEKPRAEAELLLSAIIEVDRLKLQLSLDCELCGSAVQRFEEAVRRRAGGEPLAYISGEKYFYGRRFKVDQRVLIPRPETETIIEEALFRINAGFDSNRRRLKIIDLGTGSGILALTLALELPAAEVWAVDVANSALQVARDNARLYDLEDQVIFRQGSYFKALEGIEPRPKFNLIVSNPPYISREELVKLPLSVGGFEPHLALDGGEGGLDGYREFLGDLARYVEPPALVLAEIGAGQKEAVMNIFKRSGLFRLLGCRLDLSGRPRVIYAVF